MKNKSVTKMTNKDIQSAYKKIASSAGTDYKKLEELSKEDKKTEVQKSTWIISDLSSSFKTYNTINYGKLE
jgi:hypothetical protein